LQLSSNLDAGLKALSLQFSGISHKTGIRTQLPKTLVV